MLKDIENCVLWVKISGEILLDGHDVLLCLCNNVPSGSSRQLFIDRRIFDIITDDVKFYENQYVLSDTECKFIIFGNFTRDV